MNKHSNHKKSNKIFLLGLITLMGSSSAMAASLTTPNAFTTGQPATAASVNQNFTAVETAVNANDGQINSNISAISALGSRVTAVENTTLDFSGYSAIFAALGAAKNVVVSSNEDGAGNIAYYVRSFYENNSETISIDGVNTVRQFIANYAFAHTLNGVLQSVANSLESPDTAAYNDYVSERSFYDPTSLAQTITADTERTTSKCSSGKVRVCASTVTHSGTGAYIRSGSRTEVRGILDSYTVNGMTFTDVRIRNRIEGNQVRLDAKGIGEILRVSTDNTGNERRIIYYRVNGATGGSLAGTPFDSGQLLDGLFF